MADGLDSSAKSNIPQQGTQFRNQDSFRQSRNASEVNLKLQSVGMANDANLCVNILQTSIYARLSFATPSTVQGGNVGGRSSYGTLKQRKKILSSAQKCLITHQSRLRANQESFIFTWVIYTIRTVRYDFELRERT